MANKYKKRRRQLQQTQPQNPYSYESSVSYDSAWDGGGISAPPSAKVDNPPRGWVKYVIACMLLLAVWTVYSQTARHDFTVCDDNVYIYENPAIEQGLTRPLGGEDGLFSRHHSMISWVRWEAFLWAYGDSHAGNWHPLTWITHMLDWQIYGRWSHEQQKYVDSWPGGHHLTNMIIHALSTVLLFFALRSLSGAQWSSAAVAMLFAVHPLRAESVAWSAERKDVLCGFFWMLALYCYARYGRRPSLVWYLAVSAALVLGLMAKSMIVTLPCVLLLLDFWPLDRIREHITSSRLVTLLLFTNHLKRPSIGCALAISARYIVFGGIALVGLGAKSMGFQNQVYCALAGLSGLILFGVLSFVTGQVEPNDEEESVFTDIGWFIMEKLPWLAIVGGVSYVTVLGQHKGVALNSFDALPLWMRMVNLALAYVAYIGQSFWPAHMAPFYTHLGMIPIAYTRNFGSEEITSIAIKAALLLVITALPLALVRGKALIAAICWCFAIVAAAVGLSIVAYLKIPQGALRYSMTPDVVNDSLVAGAALLTITAIIVIYIDRFGLKVAGWAAVGWFWFLGAMMPVIGLLQVGTQSRADRYTYLPAIGIAIMLVWGVRAAVRCLPALRMPLTPCVGLAAAVLIMLAWLQASYWKTSYTLFEHAVCVTDRNFFAYNHLGIAFDKDSKDQTYTLTAKHRGEFDHYNIAYDHQNPDEKLPLTAIQRRALADHSAQNFAETIKIKPDYDFGNNNLGVYYANLGDNEKAMYYFERALQCNDRYADVYNNLGVLYRLESSRLREKGQTAKADEYMQKSLARHMSGLTVRQDKASDFNNVAQTLHELGRDAEAVNMLNNALLIDPSFVAAHLSLAEILLQAKSVKDAEQHLIKAAQIDQNIIIAWCQWAMGLANKGDLPLAKSAADEILKLVPNLPVAYDILAEIAKRNKNYDEAIALCGKSQQLDPKNASHLLLMASVEEARGNRDKALQAVQASLAVDPNYVPSHAKLAEMLVGANMIGEAVEQYKIIVHLEPNIVGNWMQLGRAFLSKGDLVDALAVAKQLESIPNFAGVHELKGQIYAASSKYDDAAAEFRQAMALEPGNAGIHQGLGMSLWDGGHRSEAIAEVAEAVRLDPKNADYAAALARMRKVAGP